MPFQNRIRLPFKITRPQFPSERNVFRKANGAFKTLSAIVRKTMEGETDWMGENLHARLKIAMEHDTVNIEGDKYLGGISPDGDYEIEWQEFLDYPLAKAKFKVNVTPFAASNHNCQSCAEATQLSLTDDVFRDAYDEPLTLEEGETYEMNVATNDDICCYPAVFSITSFNSDYLISAAITQLGLLTVVLKPDLPNSNGVTLVTYRVTCPNGGYDEATVTANISGGAADACLAPENVIDTSLSTTGATFNWNPPDVLPADGYHWQLFEAATPGAPVQEADELTNEVVLTGLTPGTEYIFYVRSVCETGVLVSNYISYEFTTLIDQNEACGQYRLAFIDPEGIPTAYADVTYLDCNSEYQTVRVYHLQIKVICAQQSAPGDPDSIESSEYVQILYLDLC